MAHECEKLFYPELLNNAELIHILQERHLRIENIEKMTRYELIDLFRNFCIPHGQRKYRDSGRGKVLNQSRRLSPEPMPVDISTKKNNSNFNNMNRKVLNSNNDRLKPPPDMLSGCMKRIKLDNVWMEKDNNMKRKMSIDSISPTMDSPPKKDRKLITWP